MNPARIAIILVAGIAAVALALLVRNMAAKPKIAPMAQVSSQATQMIRVLTAKQDLTVGDRLTTDNMAWQSWPAATLNPAYVTDGMAAAPKPAASGPVNLNLAGKTVTDIATGGGPKMQSMVGGIVKETIYAGEPITAKKIVRGGDSGYMAVRLPPGTRAMSLPINVDNAAGGFIQPGDRVDVLSTHQDTAKGGTGGLIAETVLSNIKVLAVDQHTDTPKSGTTMIGATITLEVPASSAGALAKAKALGGMMIALRSYADIGGGSGGPSSASTGAGHTVRVFKGDAPVELVTSR
ncbi:MAG: Flp pilus assembly protein CpaB [Caulobacterales bacterium]